MINDFKINVYKNHATIEFKNFYEVKHEKVLKKIVKEGDVKNHHIFVVKTEFLAICPWDKVSNSLDLFKYTDIHNFFDSSEGPAIIDVLNNLRTHFNNGQIDSLFHWPVSQLKKLGKKVKNKLKKKGKKK